MNVIHRLRDAAPGFLTHPAVVDDSGQWTHAQLWDRVDRLSQALRALGLHKGSVLLAWLPNTHEALEAELACFQCGAIWVTLNAQMTWPEVAAVIAATGPAVAITSPDLYARIDLKHPFTPKTFPANTPIVVTGQAPPPGTESYEDLIAAHAPVPPDVIVLEDDIARLRYTSGTTGHVKAAVLTHRVYLASLEVQQRQLHPLSSRDRVLHAAPLTHASAALIYPILAAGGANRILARFDADHVLEIIESQRITTMFVVPTMLQRLSHAPEFHTRDLSTLRTITYGGAPIAPEALAPVINRLPGVLVQIYGLTEALHPVTTLQREEHWIGNPRLRSIGTPTHINDIRIVDNQGNPLPPGEVGEIAVRGPNVMTGYWRDNAETAKAFHGEWLLTGDLAHADENGLLYIVDRKKDVVISGGFNVYTAEVERALTEHPAVAEAAVFGIPHADWGEAVHAVVVPKPGHLLEAEAIRAHCRVLLSPYKIPKSFEIRTEPLPTSGAGKIVKTALREAHWQGCERRVH